MLPCCSWMLGFCIWDEVEDAPDGVVGTAQWAMPIEYAHWAYIKAERVAEQNKKYQVCTYLHGPCSGHIAFAGQLL